ncbi:hypothetical protein [Rufibacter sp. XAAS-G3-1]|uniref:hypothetical protein n=1 Tax=Rufibacter sp. XAAS-G3-1 TaxID=2729134 RepID=UPI0015E65CF7|nr:hypothetical protein [Rufibacter sp. XAAS-G3-1]
MNRRITLIASLVLLITFQVKAENYKAVGAFFDLMENAAIFGTCIIYICLYFYILKERNLLGFSIFALAIFCGFIGLFFFWPNLDLSINDRYYNESVNDLILGALLILLNAVAILLLIFKSLRTSIRIAFRGR